MQPWLKGGLIALCILVVIVLISVAFAFITKPDYSRTEYIRNAYRGTAFFLIPVFVFGVSLGLFIELIKKRWKNLSNYKKVAVISSIVYLLIGLFYLAYYFVLSTLRATRCPAFVDTVSCRVEDIPLYVSQILLVLGVPIFSIILIIGSFVVLILKIKNKNRKAYK